MHRIVDFRWFYMALAAVGMSGECVAAQIPNPRSATNVSMTSPRNESKTITRGDGDGAIVSRSASRSSARSATRQNIVSRSATPAKSTVARSASNISARSVTGGATTARSTSKNTASGVARAASTARATAVFNDISKIGGGYATCRDAYATCMDQFCAKANDTYRRCYCSAKFTEFRDTEDALVAADGLLKQFEDKYLNAVDKTAAEVNAMYSATVGEMAVKDDVSGAQSVLNEISDLLSGKKKASAFDKQLGLMPVDFATDMSDIWGDTGSSIFDTNTGTNLTELEGISLYNSANKQCLDVIADSCENSAVLNMATSAYNIMITQDCNAYEKVVDARRVTVEESVRQMDNALRAARLEEYRAHNSADVNECIARVKTAMTTELACGPNYVKCLDYSGKYIDTAGEPILHSPDLFKVTQQITLGGSDDIIGQNTNYNTYLNSKRIFVESALDTCRDISDIVWSEFKRQAIIEIAQAQADKIEEIKMSCVNTMKQCYDTQSKAIKSFDAETANMVGALSAAVARDMCQDKVEMCSKLYADNENGLDSLITLVETIDDARINQGCETALRNYATDLCTPKTGTQGYPWNCIKQTNKDLDASLTSAAKTYCPTVVGEKLNTNSIVTDVLNEVSDAIADVMMTACEEMDSLWYEADEDMASDDDVKKNADKAFYNKYFGQTTPTAEDYGICIEDTERLACEEQDGITGITGSAKWNETRGECEFSASWYEWACANMLGGYLENGVCYWDANQPKDDDPGKK